MQLFDFQSYISHMILFLLFQMNENVTEKKSEPDL